MKVPWHSVREFFGLPIIGSRFVVRESDGGPWFPRWYHYYVGFPVMLGFLWLLLGPRAEPTATIIGLCIIWLIQYGLVFPIHLHRRRQWEQSEARSSQLYPRLLPLMLGAPLLILIWSWS